MKPFFQKNACLPRTDATALFLTEIIRFGYKRADARRENRERVRDFRLQQITVAMTAAIWIFAPQFAAPGSIETFIALFGGVWMLLAMTAQAWRMRRFGRPYRTHRSDAAAGILHADWDYMPRPAKR